MFFISVLKVLLGGPLENLRAISNNDSSGSTCKILSLSDVIVLNDDITDCQ